jgi:hypothetical protein
VAEPPDASGPKSPADGTGTGVGVPKPNESLRLVRALSSVEDSDPPQVNAPGMTQWEWNHSSNGAHGPSPANCRRVSAARGSTRVENRATMKRNENS